MSDQGHDETEILLQQLEREISDIYYQASREVAAKLDDYMRRFATKDEIKRRQVAEGTITEEEYEEWRVGQIAMGKRWAELRDTLAEDYVNADKIAANVIDGYRADVYALNHNYGTYEVEEGALVDTSYTLYDRQTVERMLRDNPDMLPPPGKKVSRDIREGRAVRWNSKQIQSVMMQSLLQGEAIPDIATRLAKAVGDSDRKAAIRNARTMVTCAENGGRVDSYKRAVGMGIDMKQMWVATLDNRTRHSHRLLDGVTVEVGDKFPNGLEFPGDPSGDAEEIYNCRCTLIAQVKGFEHDVTDLSLRHDDNLDGMTYDEWKEAHEESKDILAPDKQRAAAKWSYIKEYMK